MEHPLGPSLYFLFAMVLLPAVSARGQGPAGVGAAGGAPFGPPRAEFFYGYSYLGVDSKGLTPKRLIFNGWDGSATFNPHPLAGIEFDFSGHYRGNCNGISNFTCKEVSFLAGPRLAFRTGRTTIFVHGLFGGDIVGAGFLGLPASRTDTALAAGGGLDYAATKWVSIRLGQADYFLTAHSAGPAGARQNNVRVSGGVVFTLGRE